MEDGEIDIDELVNASEPSHFIGTLVSGNGIDFELAPPIDSVLFVRSIPDRLSPSSELLSVIDEAAFDVVFLSG